MLIQEIEGKPLVSFLIEFIIIAAMVSIVWYVLSVLPLPEVAKTVLTVIAAIIGLVYLASLL